MPTLMFRKENPRRDRLGKGFGSARVKAIESILKFFQNFSS